MLEEGTGRYLSNQCRIGPVGEEAIVESDLKLNKPLEY